MSKLASPPRISGVGFMAMQVSSGRWAIYTNPLPGESIAYPVSDVICGDAATARAELRQWSALYQASRPRAGERVRAAA